MERLRAALSYFLSFRRAAGSWRFEDYPIRISEQQVDADSNVPRYVAQVINWWALTGTGDTAVEAIDELKQRFEEFKNAEPVVPRPGSHVPIRFADSTIVESNPEIYRKFIVEVLGFGPEDPVFFSDESSLLDFEGVNDDVDLFEQVRNVFGVDVKDIEDGNLATIFTRIKHAGE